MDHLTLKAVVTTTDQGVFKAVISTESVDREKDVVSADAMVAALRKWNRPIPLAWNHGTQADDIFGAIDAQTVENIDGEVVAEGQVDLESKVGPDAWRSFKNRTIGFSFGYLILTATKRAGGGRNIRGLDVFEITATPTPMNNDTRVLSTKGVEEQREEAKRVEREVEEAQIPDVPEQPEVPREPEINVAKELQEVKARLATAETALEDLNKKAEEMDKGRKVPSMDPLRERAEAVALEVASGGESLRKPPKTVAPKRLEPSLSLEELKEQTREQMLGVLSGGTIE